VSVEQKARRRTSSACLKRRYAVQWRQRACFTASSRDRVPGHRDWLCVASDVRQARRQRHMLASLSAAAHVEMDSRFRLLAQEASCMARGAAAAQAGPGERLPSPAASAHRAQSENRAARTARAGRYKQPAGRRRSPEPKSIPPNEDVQIARSAAAPAASAVCSRLSAEEGPREAPAARSSQNPGGS